MTDVNKNKKICVPNAEIDFDQYDPKNLANWGEYIPVGDEMKLLELTFKYGTMPYLIEGDKGVGKTLLVYTLCRKLGYPLVEFSCSSNTNKGDLLGRTQINDDGSFFELGVLPISYEVANKYGVCVLYLDELNANQHDIMKLLNRPFDKRRSVVANNKIYKLNEGCRLVIVGTMNPITYSGVNSLTEDLRSRMIGDILTYPTSKQLENIIDWDGVEENTIKRPLLTLAQETHALRMKGDVEYVLSPRDIDQFCEYYRMLHKELEPLMALTYSLKQVIIAKYSEVEERELITARINEIFGTNVK